MVDVAQEMLDARQPSLADLWAGRAHFVVDRPVTGLPLGESDTVQIGPQLYRSYIHASAQSHGTTDQCGDPVPFPGCLIIMQSNDGGNSFSPLSKPPVCQLPCAACPCTSQHDQIDQQQYPRVARSSLGNLWLMVYEYRATVMLHRSSDGLQWGPAEAAPMTGIWQDWLMPCSVSESIGAHPNLVPDYDCLIGSPPGIYLDEQGLAPEFYIFVGTGQNPGAMGCLRGSPYQPASMLRKCQHNPLFSGAADYGPLDDDGPLANPHFDFRTVSSAKIAVVDNHYYMLYEGVRGPAAGAAGDTQFALGLARSTTTAIDAPWETYSGNPILVDLPGNVGVGHADLLLKDGITYLYTSLDNATRSRLKLVWGDAPESTNSLR
jgi:hypothetical protein